MGTVQGLKRNFVTALFALLAALFAIVAATFAWYIYHTSSHTTKVHMAAGTGVSLEISNQYSEGYGSATVLEEFNGWLNPVSTNKISNGFQKVLGFTNGDETQPKLVANLFGPSETSDYYKTSLYIRTNHEKLDVYLSGIGYEDDDENLPISTAIRVGIVPHYAGKDQDESGEYIFAINDAENPEKEYNTATGEEGYVLDSTKTDGTTIPFEPYDSRNFCIYDSESGAVTLKDESLKICTVSGTGNDYGEPVQVDIYIWLEGCDQDCTRSLCGKTLKNLALSFAGYAQG